MTLDKQNIDTILGPAERLGPKAWSGERYWIGEDGRSPAESVALTLDQWRDLIRCGEWVVRKTDSDSLSTSAEHIEQKVGTRTVPTWVTSVRAGLRLYRQDQHR